MKVPAQLKAEFARACRLLDRTQSQVLHRTVRKTIQLARQEFGAKFDATSLPEEMVFEAISEAGLHEISEICAFTGLSVADVVAALKRLVARKAIERRSTGKKSESKYLGARPAELFFLPLS